MSSLYSIHLDLIVFYKTMVKAIKSDFVWGGSDEMNLCSIGLWDK